METTSDIAIDFASQSRFGSVPEISLLENITQVGFRPVPGRVSGDLGASKGSQLPTSLKWPSANILCESCRRHAKWIPQGWTKGLPSRQAQHLQLPIPRKAQHLEHVVVKFRGRRNI